jgi:hypothetical protein
MVVVTLGTGLVEGRFALQECKVLFNHGQMHSVRCKNHLMQFGLQTLEVLHVDLDILRTGLVHIAKKTNERFNDTNPIGRSSLYKPIVDRVQDVLRNLVSMCCSLNLEMFDTFISLNTIAHDLFLLLFESSDFMRAVFLKLIKSVKLVFDCNNAIVSLGDCLLVILEAFRRVFCVFGLELHFIVQGVLLQLAHFAHNVDQLFFGHLIELLLEPGFLFNSEQS